MDQHHIDTFCNIRDKLKGAVPTNVKGYALVAYDDNGEIYWGASYPGPAHLLKGVVQKLRIIQRDIQQAIKET